MDERDKTVFRQPLPGGDRTVMKPSPGSGGRPVTRPSAPGDTAGYGRPAPSQQQPAQPSYQQGYGGRDSASFAVTRGLNPLVNIASTLIAVYANTRGSVRHANVAGLHKNLVEEIRQFENKARDHSIPAETVWAARYLLCCALDEVVLHTPWGGESAWGQRTLLSIFNNETSGGEKCFQILEKMRAAPADNLYILELFYIFLSLGYEGKFRLMDRGRDALDTLRDDLFRTIRGFRGEYERALSPTWTGLGKTRKSLSQYIPTWVAASVFGALLFLGFAGFSYWVYKQSNPVVESLEAVIVKPAEEPTRDSVFDKEN